MKKTRTIYGSGSSALTPEPPTPQSEAATIYKELLWWRDRAKAMERAYHDAERKYHAEAKRFTRFRARGLARGISKRFQPNHNPEATL